MTLHGPHDLQALAKRIEWLGWPVTVSVRKGVRRSLRANRLAQRWASDVAEQTGETPEEVRARFKLTLGIPIRREDPEYAAAYDAIVRPLPYEDKLRLMAVPLDWPVTRDMTAKQLSRYMDAIQKECAEAGLSLTDPEALKYGV